ASSEATVVEGKENNLDKSKMDSVSEEVSKVATESNESVDVAVSEHKDKAHIIDVSSENFSVEAEIVDTISPRGEKIENVSEETNEIIYSNSS
ncbi:hypothetical protein, partial [Halorubellus sp. PRR65]|uniref:hypothetical protein n=1 Tax=Halorubellus sp. PRR65 TaxID=3098148 RepID=UPI002B25CF47